MIPYNYTRGQIRNLFVFFIIYLKFLAYIIANNSDQFSTQYLSARSPEAALKNQSESDTGELANLLHNYEKVSILVYEVLNRVANHSWEWGTQSHVILERNYPCLSVFSQSNPLPFERDNWNGAQTKALSDLIDPIIATRREGKLPIVDGDGSSADPASLGVAVLVSAVTAQKKEKAKEYLKLAQDQYTFLIKDVPRSKSGAISHREAEMQFWSDFVYMVPPFLAFYGAQESNFQELELAYTQIKLYRDALSAPLNNVKLWRHVLPANATINDHRFWSTGNGWAAAGSMRVYATLLNLQDKNLQSKTERMRNDLANWTEEIIVGAFSFQDAETGLLPNVFGPNILDCSGTSVIASAAFRLLSYEPQRHSSLPMKAIIKAVEAVFTKYTNPQTGSVAPVVNPLDWSSEVPFNGSKPETGYVSPEGQAFGILLQEAIRAYLKKIDKKNEKKYASNFVLIKDCY
ncbi:hypothetical protein BY996DRAFT_4583530 [Phakopsora pachyrhizi]|uniref:Uncharacterized protein n=1 Tax=Phakopsora pachyrhizi TaxID=170000 RepID=A0AAV0ANB4_PHAPC|nr:hypothetical protein BY996DRAFT_4583530 [Phakopsora pachyrhizi]CAH7669031.1 hypothetical protein PPACK8108_LOCUS3594 [Phakopsora pachyrhizi]